MAEKALLDALRQSKSFGHYRELYPSLPERLRLILDCPNPGIRQRLQELGRVLGERNDERTAWIVEKYGLTPAEARVALHLAEGGTIASCSREFGIGPGTVRTHLKAVFAKTGINRQAGIATLLARRRLSASTAKS